MRRTSWLSLAAMVGCSSASTPVTKATPPTVEVWGALREMIHEGRTESRVAIASVLAKPHVYALGAVAGMRGEVTIVDGTVWLALGDVNEGKAVSGPTNEGAALLVASSVSAWRETTIDRDIPFSDLDRRVEEYAVAAGIDVDKPFPFVIEGELTDVHWHVLKGPPAPGADPHDHSTNAVVGEGAMKATVVGFFSKHHQGVFTHMGQNTHAHVVTATASFTAHADQFSIVAQSVLRFSR